jgi:WD40 repeat protein
VCLRATIWPKLTVLKMFRADYRSFLACGADDSHNRTSGYNLLWMRLMKTLLWVFCLARTLTASTTQDMPLPELVAQAGHSQSIHRVLFADGDRLLISASDDGTVRVWDTQSGQLLRILYAHTHAVLSMAASPDEAMIATSGDDSQLKIWNVDTGGLQFDEPIPYPITALAWSVDGTQLTASSSVETKVFTRASNAKFNVARSLPASSQVSYVGGSSHIVALATLGKIRFWDTNTGTAISESYNLQGDVVRMQPAANGVYVAETYYVALLHDSATVQQEFSRRNPASLNDLALGSQVPFLFTVASDNKLTLWNSSDGTAVNTIMLASAPYTSVAVSKRGDLAAVGQPDGTLELLSLPIGQRRWRSPGMRNAIVNVQFQDNSLSVLQVLGSRTFTWQIGPDEQRQGGPGSIMRTEEARLLSNDDLVISGPMQVIVGDMTTRRVMRQLQTSSIFGWPLRCNDHGFCVWDESREGRNYIKVVDVVHETLDREFDLGTDGVVDLDINGEGTMVAAVVNRAVVRMWSVKDEKELSALPLETRPSERFTPWAVWMPRGKMMMFDAGMGSVVRFAPDGKRLAVGNDGGVYVWEIKESRSLGVLRVPAGLGTTLCWTAAGDGLVIAAQNGNLSLWRNFSQSQGEPIGTLERSPEYVTTNRDSSLIAVSFSDGLVELWDSKQRVRIASISFTSRPGWIAATPDGLLDVSESAWRDAIWRLDGSTLKHAPIEQFFRDFYYPGLVSDLLSGIRPSTSLQMAKLDRETPSVEISCASVEKGTLELVPGQDMRVSPPIAHLRIQATPSEPSRSIYDLRLTKNDALVRQWQGKLPLVNGKFVKELVIPLNFSGSTRFGVSAFNKDGVRSLESSCEPSGQGPGGLVPPRTLHVLAIGIQQYQNRQFSLQFPEEDVKLVEEQVNKPDSAWTTLRQVLSQWQTNQFMVNMQNSFADSPPPEVPVRTHFVRLLSASATREGILEALREMVKEVQPQDILMIYYSGHGIHYRGDEVRDVHDQDHYYLLPYDMAIQGSPFEVTMPAIRAAASTLISDADIEKELRGVNFAAGALILDSCESGQAIAGGQLRGPLDGNGLGYLAYEKGFDVLAASESVRPAAELQELGNSLLTYALFKEGLAERHADVDPRDGRIDLQELLAYASRRVPELQQEKKPNTPPASLQRPEFLRRRIEQSFSVVLDFNAQAAQ